MNHNRSTNFVIKQSSISTISSHVPLQLMNQTTEPYLLTQTSINLNTSANVHNLLQPFSMTSASERKRARTMCQPKGTIPYTVNETDTLEKIALHFNLTPSELLHLNKLNTRMVFPGQIVFVPEECPSDNSNQQQSTTSSHHPSQQDVGPMVWSITRQSTARPGRAERLESRSSIESEPSPGTIEERLSTLLEDNDKQVRTLRRSLLINENQQLDEECLQRFIKAHVQLMTEDRQSIAGTLLITPNAVMFDPDERHPLIKEHGIEKYGLIIRMDLLADIALYEDLALYEYQATARDEEKRKMYHSVSVKSVLHNPPNTPLNTNEEQIHDLMISLLDQIDKELNPSASTDTCCMLFNASSTIHRHISKNSLDDNNEIFLPIPSDDISLDNSLELSNNFLEPLDEYKHSIGILLNENDEKNDNKKNLNFNRVPSQISYTFDWKRFQRAVKIKKGCYLENCVPLDEFNKRFGEIDKLLYKQDPTYFVPHPIETPYYLCITTSTHIHDIPSLSARQYRKSSDKITDTTYGKKRLEHEYWFSVPKEKIDHLYSFFLRWTPEHAGDPLIEDDHDQPVDTARSKSNDKTSHEGFVLLATDDPELTDDHFSSKNEKQKTIHYLKQQPTLLKEWEIISVDEIYRRLHAADPNNDTNEEDNGIPPPNLLQQSTLINEEQAKLILIELPARVHGLNWYMTFSTETHGFSLNQLYRRSVEIDHDLPSLLIVKDVEHNVFGAFIPHQLMLSDGFYGTGESFLFTFHPDFRVFHWSRCNEFYVKGDINSLGFGSGEGAYGLWIDADLCHGRTCPSKTFNNDMLTSNEDFIIASIEVWTFTD